MSGTGAQAPIIKKVRKKGHEAGHGGSWKVAYADFVTAMMAFFLLLWLLSMASEEQRARVSEYFKSFSLFDKGGQSFMMDNQITKSKIEIVETQEAGDDSSGKGNKNSSEGSALGNSAGIGGSPADRLKEKLKSEIEQKLSSMKDQVLVDIYDGAVRIEVVDKKGGSTMFNSGSREMTDEGKRALRVIADSIKDVEGRIAIEGHTDASNYAGSQYSNWELSTDRASAARRELENSGMSPERLIRVAGYASTEPLIAGDPLDPKNRRISIKVFPEETRTLPGASSVTSQDEIQESNEGRVTGKIKGEKDQDIDPVDNYLMTR